MKIKKENVLAAYKTAREAGADSTCKVLASLFGEEVFKPKDVTERIKTFEDACRELGDDHPLVREWSLGDNFSKDLEAYLKLRIICAALNEGWEPQFTNNELQYFPWFYIYTKEELEEMDEEDSCRAIGRGGNGANTGLACADVYPASSRSYTHCGSRLALKSKKLATYCGKQFIDIWADFVC